MVAACRDRADVDHACSPRHRADDRPDRLRRRRVARYQAVLDDFAVPDGWELMLTRSVTPDSTPSCGGLFGECPRAIRYYLASGAGADIYAAAKARVTSAGFELDLEIRPTCDADPPRTPACGITASRESDLLQVDIYNAGEDPDNFGVTAADRMQVRLIAQPTR